jgi:hypothetical protein
MEIPSVEAELMIRQAECWERHLIAARSGDKAANRKSLRELDRANRERQIGHPLSD